jgi:probable rRNA maturation factor
VKVPVAIRWKEPKVAPRFVARVARAALASGRRARPGRGERELSIALTGDAEIRRINRRFLGHDWATDVIAFPLGDGDAEVVVSLERAVAQARARGHPWRAELALYIVHGVLHLHGHDDHEPAARRRMLAAERRVLAALGYEVPDRV